MKKAISLKLKTLLLLSMGVFVGGTLTGCQDEVDESNRYTFTGETIATHLENNPEKYSHFVDILKQAKINNNVQSTLFEMLSTYGAYTCIAPTNDALEQFVSKQYNTYKASKDSAELYPDKYTVIETGIYSPYVSDLSIEKCTEIAKNHIIEDAEFKTVDFSDGYSLPKTSMSYRTITVHTGIKDDERYYSFGIDGGAVAEETDISTYNGTIHAVNNVMNPSTETANDALNDVDCISIFREAINETGISDLLSIYEIDEVYDNTKTTKIFNGQSGQVPLLPETKNQGYTLLLEPNEVLLDPNNNAYGMSIANLDDLKEFAELVYGSEPGFEDSLSHPKNALFKFMSYHIIDRTLDFVKNGVGGWIMEGYDHNGFKSDLNMGTDYDWSDYFETYLPYDNWEYTEEELDSIKKGYVKEGCMIKVTRPYTNSEYKNDVVLNYCTTTPSDEMSYHTNIRVMSQSDAAKKYETVKNDSVALEPINAKVHFIDKILVYNEEEMKSNVINERMRWDAISLFPELTTNRVRWDFTANTLFRYIPAGADDSDLEKQFSKRLKARNNDTEIFYMRPITTYSGSYTNYQGDEFLIEGVFDAEIRLPHVPQGTYEIRIGFSTSTRRGVIQFYLGKEICGIPTDMRLNDANTARMGWFDDSEYTDEEISDNEKAMRNRGYMKAPASVFVQTGVSMRDASNAFRRILVTNQELTPKKDGYWMRVKNVTEGSSGAEEYNMDYLEIVPKSIYNNPAKPEDKY